MCARQPNETSVDERPIFELLAEAHDVDEIHERVRIEGPDQLAAEVASYAADLCTSMSDPADLFDQIDQFVASSDNLAMVSLVAGVLDLATAPVVAGLCSTRARRLAVTAASKPGLRVDGAPSASARLVSDAMAGTLETSGPYAVVALAGALLLLTSAAELEFVSRDAILDTIFAFTRTFVAIEML